MAWALLRHDLPDHSFHYDWLIAHAGAPANSGLATWRIDRRVDLVHDPRPFAGLRLKDHRRLYLTFEGQVPDSAEGEPRGRVRRLAGGPHTFGLCRWIDHGGVEVVCDTPAGRRLWRGEPDPGEPPRWTFIPF